MKKYKAIASELFNLELKEALDYIRYDKSTISGANNLAKKVNENIDNIKIMPEAFKEINFDGKNDHPIRYCMCYNYVILYTFIVSEINLLRFLYAKSDLKNRLK